MEIYEEKLGQLGDSILSSPLWGLRLDHNSEIVNFPFLERDVLRSHSYGVYISQLICLARVSSHVDDFINRNTFLTS